MQPRDSREIYKCTKYVSPSPASPTEAPISTKISTSRITRSTLGHRQQQIALTSALERWSSLTRVFGAAENVMLGLRVFFASHFTPDLIRLDLDPLHQLVVVVGTHLGAQETIVI
jgi:hypothetical protein